MTTPSASRLSVRPLHPALGAGVPGIDMRQPRADDTRRELLDSWMQHPVLVLRGQPVSDEEHMDFRQRGGNMVTWIGNADPAVSARASVEWVKSVDTHADGKAGDFLKLFGVPSPTRPPCHHPRYARHDGVGNINFAASFSCR